MFARVASFQGVNVGAAQETMGQAEAIVRPLLEGLAGYQAHYELVGAGGTALSITLFDSEASARAAEPTFDEELPRRLGELFKDWEGTRVSVEHYDVLVDSRA